MQCTTYTVGFARTLISSLHLSSLINTQLNSIQSKNQYYRNRMAINFPRRKRVSRMVPDANWEAPDSSHSIFTFNSESKFKSMLDRQNYTYKLMLICLFSPKQTINRICSLILHMIHSEIQSPIAQMKLMKSNISKKYQPKKIVWLQFPSAPLKPIMNLIKN